MERLEHIYTNSKSFDKRSLLKAFSELYKECMIAKLEFLENTAMLKTLRDVSNIRLQELIIHRNEIDIQILEEKLNDIEKRLYQ